MPEVVDRDQLQALVRERDAQVVEVLPEEEYRWAHLPGAVHLPLGRLDDAPEVLAPDRPVVVYCNDFL